MHVACCHVRQRNVCIECHGGSICEHRQRRTRCLRCGGGSLCAHGKRKDKCSNCPNTRIRARTEFWSKLSQKPTDNTRNHESPVGVCRKPRSSTLSEYVVLKAVSATLKPSAGKLIVAHPLNQVISDTDRSACGRDRRTLFHLDQQQLLSSSDAGIASPPSQSFNSLLIYEGFPSSPGKSVESVSREA